MTATKKKPSNCPVCGEPTYRIGGYCSRRCEKIQKRSVEDLQEYMVNTRRRATA